MSTSIVNRSHLFGVKMYVYLFASVFSMRGVLNVATGVCMCVCVVNGISECS